MKKIILGKRIILSVIMIIIGKHVDADLSSRASEKFVPVGSRAAGGIMSFTGSMGEYGSVAVAPVTIPAATGALVVGAPMTAVNIAGETARQIKKAYDNRNETKEQRLDRKIAETQEAMEALSKKANKGANNDEVEIQTSSVSDKDRDKVGRNIEGLISAMKNMKGNLTDEQHAQVTDIYQKLKNPDAAYTEKYVGLSLTGDFVGYQDRIRNSDLKKMKDLSEGIQKRERNAVEFQKEEEKKALPEGLANQVQNIDPRQLQSKVAKDNALRNAINVELEKQKPLPEEKKKGLISSIMARFDKLFEIRPRPKVHQELDELYKKNNAAQENLDKAENELLELRLQKETFEKEEQEKGASESVIRQRISERFQPERYLENRINDLRKSIQITNTQIAHKHVQDAEEELQNRMKENPDYIKNMIKDMTKEAEQRSNQNELTNKNEKEGRLDNVDNKPPLLPKPVRVLEEGSKPPLPPKPENFGLKVKPPLPPKPQVELEEKGPWE